MTNKIRTIFEQFMSKRFSYVKKEEHYYSEWESRFNIGMEWQRSDYKCRELLMSLAPDVYPKDREEFFVRE